MTQKRNQVISHQNFLVSLLFAYKFFDLLVFQELSGKISDIFPKTQIKNILC